MTFAITLATIAFLAIVAVFIIMIWIFALDTFQSDGPFAGCLALILAAAITLLIFFLPFLGVA